MRRLVLAATVLAAAVVVFMAGFLAGRALERRQGDVEVKYTLKEKDGYIYTDTYEVTRKGKLELTVSHRRYAEDGSKGSYWKVVSPDGKMVAADEKFWTIKRQWDVPEK